MDVNTKMQCLVIFNETVDAKTWVWKDAYGYWRHGGSHYGTPEGATCTTHYASLAVEVTTFQIERIGVIFDHIVAMLCQPDDASIPEGYERDEQGNVTLSDVWTEPEMSRNHALLMRRSIRVIDREAKELLEAIPASPTDTRTDEQVCAKYMEQAERELELKQEADHIERDREDAERERAYQDSQNTVKQATQ